MPRDERIEDRTLELWTSNSFRRFGFRHGGHACEPIKQNDGHPDLLFPGGPEGEVARRFVATWNACKGYPTSVLESGSLRQILIDAIEGRAALEARAGRMSALLRTFEQKALADAEFYERLGGAMELRDHHRAIAAVIAAARADA